jgi:predicted alpha/beta hydrolase family esterase
MKNVIIFHGTDCSPDNEFYWYKWLKNELEDHGYKVFVPHYPDINHEPINTFLPKVMNDHQFDTETILVGHSAGSPLILSILEKINIKVKLSVLVAGYSKRLPGETLDPVLQELYDWKKIKSSSEEFVFINSVNDPWGCDDKQGRTLFDNLGGTQIIRSDGHFGSESQNLPYTEFPLLRDVILETEL